MKSESKADSRADVGTEPGTETGTESRTDKVARNMKFALLCQILMVLVNFVFRRVFVLILGQEYLGLNGLFSDILSMLSVAELGFGTSIIFSLYRPVADGDREKVKSLMRLYRNIYRVVGVFVLVAGAALTPWLDFFVKEMPDIPEDIRLIYLLNVVNSAMSYFFIYKASLLFADQKKYIETIITTVIKVAAALGETVVLLTSGSYIAYLCVVIAGTALQNYLISRRVDRMYPYITEPDAEQLTDSDKQLIKKDVGAMVFHKLGSVVIFSTDSILMAKFVSVAAVGLYSNYTLIKNALDGIIRPMYEGITSGFGNLNVTVDRDHFYESFNKVLLFSAWIFGLCAICLMNLFNPFITLWLGEGYTFNNINVLLIVVSFYLSMMRKPVISARDAMGLFTKDKYKPIPECLINLVLSIIWAKQFSAAWGDEYGIAGIVLGTIASTLLVPFWIEPLVVFRYGFRRKVWGYYGRYLGYTAVTAAAGIGTWILCGLMPGGFAGLILRGLISLIIPNLVFILLYHRLTEYRYIREYGLSKIKPLLDRLKRKYKLF